MLKSDPGEPLREVDRYLRDHAEPTPGARKELYSIRNALPDHILKPIYRNPWNR